MQGTSIFIKFVSNIRTFNYEDIEKYIGNCVYFNFNDRL
ncbi:hypothetical protein SAMN04515667_0412 [Formosa sp. Hel1_31_208]|nr:hypothetical protein SAMN04515667_0412 [Formosa sp. Hel1_31_208]